jgi:ketopantoate reductase
MVITRTIAILGACSKNGTTAGKKLAANNRLLLVDEDKEKLSALKAEIEGIADNVEVEMMECFQDTGWEADAIVLAIQSIKDKEIFTLMKPFVTGKTVIVFSSGEKETEQLKSLLSYSNVISINEADCECVNKMQTILNEVL